MDGEPEFLEGMAGAVVAVADDGRIAHANRQAIDLLGHGDLVGKPLAAIIPARLRAQHHAGFQRYLAAGQSRLDGSTVRVPALLGDSSEQMLDLTLRVHRRPDGSRLVVAALAVAGLGQPPPGLRVIEDALAKRLYELI